MKLYKPRKIYLETEARDYPMTARILDQYPDVPVEEITNTRQLIETVLQDPDPITFGKQFLLLSKLKAKFLKKCPGTKNYICCGYRILNTANNCDFECSYCILQGYFTNPLMVVHTNIEDLLEELDQELTGNPNRFSRIGTGELTDSLTLEPITHYGEQLVKFFSNYKNAIVELKTKSVHIDNLLSLDHRGRTVMAWSLNSDYISENDEKFAATLDQRLEAAARCQEAGYRLAFHFDPMIDHPGWEEGYYKTVKKLFSVIDGRNIAWISLGALRYPTFLDGIIRKRHPESDIVYGEFISGKDNKARYFKPIRIEMFRKMNEWIHDFDPSVFVYLCMESDEVWQKSFGWSPKKISTLSKMLDDRVRD